MQHSKEHIIELLEKFGFSTSDIEVTYDEPSHTIWFSIASNDSRYLLGRGAEALSSLNYIAHKVLEKKTREIENPPRVIIDANDFERKKVENIKTIAHMMAERARYFKSSISVDPMSARDRRIVHEALADATDIETESQGEGKGRHVVITYIGKEV